MLKGYATYIACFVAVITAVGAYLSGTSDLSATIQLISTAVIGIFLRRGVANGTGK